MLYVSLFAIKKSWLLFTNNMYENGILIIRYIGMEAYSLK